MTRSSRIIEVVIATKATQSRRRDCGRGFAWIAPPSLATTVGTASK
jgi:hypothetical protein